MVLRTKITEMLGIKHPIIAAPMGPFYTKELAVAVSEAGGLGVLSHTNMFGKNSIEEMKKDMEYVIENTDKPFGLNIRTARMQPDATEEPDRILVSSGFLESISGALVLAEVLIARQKILLYAHL